MEYPIHSIFSREAIAECPLFQVDHFQWNCLYKPETSGRMGYLSEYGFYIKMVCKERDPRRIFHNPGDPVCRDSAMEVFLALPDRRPPQGESLMPSDSSLYLNFEANANGALYAKYGWGRENRKFFPPEEFSEIAVKTAVEKDHWTLELLIPQRIFRRLCGVDRFLPGDVVYCNFYKIAESPDIEHYASFSPIGSETPNFHLPRFFARGEIR